MKSQSLPHSKIKIPHSLVTAVNKQTTAYVFANAIEIVTKNESVS